MAVTEPRSGATRRSSPGSWARRARANRCARVLAAIRNAMVPLGALPILPTSIAQVWRLCPGRLACYGGAIGDGQLKGGGQQSLGVGRLRAFEHLRGKPLLHHFS